MPDADDLALLLAAGREAARIASSYFGKEQKTWTKGGGSPVGEADVATDDYLRGVLTAARPDYGWLSEETADEPTRLKRRSVFVVDPIDGTRAFLRGDPSWSVSLAIVEQARPRVAVLIEPVAGLTFTAQAGRGAFLDGRVLSAPALADPAMARIAAPKQGFPVTLPAVAEIVPKIPSLALRIARVASGAIDAAYASSDSHDWDLAAADLILTEAGGRLTDLDGSRLAYNGAVPRHRALIGAETGLQTRLLALAAAAGGRTAREPG